MRLTRSDSTSKYSYRHSVSTSDSTSLTKFLKFWLLVLDHLVSYPNFTFISQTHQVFFLRHPLSYCYHLDRRFSFNSRSNFDRLENHRCLDSLHLHYDDPQTHEDLFSFTFTLLLELLVHGSHLRMRSIQNVICTLHTFYL